VDSASTVAIISVIASSAIALVGVIVPQVVAARKATLDRTIAHMTWWRDKRSELYIDILGFCAQAEQPSHHGLNEELIDSLEPRVAAISSGVVGREFRRFIAALRSNSSDELHDAGSKLRTHIPTELWELSQGIY
jgi:hypothetical protein